MSVSKVLKTIFFHLGIVKYLGKETLIIDPVWANFSESTESAEPNEEENQPKQMTLDEWKKMQEKNRMKSDFKLRRAGEGVDNSQWKTGREYRKSEGDEEESGEEEEESDEEEVCLPIKI